MTSKQTEKLAAPGPVELARQRPVELNAQELKFGQQFRKTFVDLTALRSKRGRAVLEGAVPSEVNRQIRELEDSLETSAEAAAAARELRFVAIDALRQVEADEMERQAARCDVDAAANKAAVDEKRRELEAIAGCGYVSADELAYARRGQLGGGAGNVSVMTVQIPIFKQHLNEAKALRLRAAQARVQEPQRAGSVEAATLDELISRVHSEPLRIGPPIADIVQWCDDAAGRDQKRRQQRELPEAPITKLLLEWRNAVIDVSSSFVSSAQNAPGGQAIDTDAEFARAAATEQSA